MILPGTSRPEFIRAETLPDLLKSTVDRQPQHVAIEDGPVSLTYFQLWSRAEFIARALAARGCGPGECLGLWMPRGAELIVGQVAIALSGAAWLPFDAAIPLDRLATCMRDAKGRYVLTNAAGAEGVKARGLTPLVLAELEFEESTAQIRQAASNDIAYVIYTSGSTGEPKGIAISQRNVCHFIRSENEVIKVREIDRVYQGFSVAFDMSLEEIWISFFAGATLWVAPADTVGDPDAIAQVLAAQRITVMHAVPTLAALIPAFPPALRLLNLGGEACPDALAAKLTGRTFEVYNTYGPTETTVTATIARLLPGKSVNIGIPLPNYGMGVCDAEHRLLPSGQTGELVVFGPGVSKGYVGRAELTAARFVVIDGQSAYLTGDLGIIEADGEIRCLGRVDNQIKLRGFRIELDEISAALADQPGVGTAAAVVRPVAGNDEIAAFVVLTSGGPDVEALRRALTARLPTYMVPAHFEFIAEMPRLSSGKIDLGALRRRELTIRADAGSELPPPADAHEAALRMVLSELLPGRRLSSDADFFSDLGGHSLLAARLVSILRRNPCYAGMGVQHVYRNRRLAAIAQALRDLAAVGASKATAPRHESAPLVRRFLCGLAQALCLPFLILLQMLQWLSPFFAYHWLTGDAEDSVAWAIVVALGTYLAALALTFPLGVLLRRLLVGRLSPGNYPLWGGTYFRWWLGVRLNEIPAVHLIAGTPWKAWHFRMLGAKVGRHCTINAVTASVPELLEIGEGVCLGTFVNIENAKVEGGRLVIGRVCIGDNAAVDSYAVIEGDTRIGDRARLGGQSALAEGRCIPDGEVWAGAPARKVAESVFTPPPPRLSKLMAGLRNGGFILGAAVVALLFYVPIFPSFVVIDSVDSRWLDIFENFDEWWKAFPVFFLLALPASAILLLITVGLAGVLRQCLPRQLPGRYSLEGRAYFWKWQLSAVLDASLQILHGLYASIYVGTWLRLMGTKVGRDAEVSTAEGIVPELLELGDESFIADGAMLGDEGQQDGWMTLNHTRIGSRSFVGNGAYVPDGAVFPDDVLLGVQSSAPANDLLKPGQTWMGSPPMLLPARETIQAQDPTLTFRPSWARRCARGFVEGLRIIVPLAFVIAAGYVTVFETMPYLEDDDVTGFLMTLTAAGILYAAVSFAFVWTAKWLLIGRYRPRLAPMWTMFVWVSEAVTTLHESLAVPAILNLLRGTPMLPWALRLLGAKIGRGVWMNTTDLTEFDCVTIGDEAELNDHSGPQTHLFEDRVMRIGKVEIGARTTIGVRSTVLYSSSVGEGVHLGPLTLVAKGEQIPAATSWEGTPSAPAVRLR
ncbi:MAG: Pls/PosA family non-ribosomal peptide synthetase [Verrucomicrobiota bacterium]|jgi:non-ribosomal peptide synthetase-like protein